MIDFSPVLSKQTTLRHCMADLTLDDLRRLANEITDTIQAMLETCSDADITFVPHDPQADDSPEGFGWTIGHVLAHITAGAEETAFLAAELARGVEQHGRSRYEVPWESITTVAQCQQRLEESRRMRLATLDVWPDTPYLETTQEMPFLGEHVNAYGHFGLGLMHDGMHLKQIAETIRQAHKARGIA